MLDGLTGKRTILNAHCSTIGVIDVLDHAIHDLEREEGRPSRYIHGSGHRQLLVGGHIRIGGNSTFGDQEDMTYSNKKEGECMPSLAGFRLVKP